MLSPRHARPTFPLYLFATVLSLCLPALAQPVFLPSVGAMPDLQQPDSQILAQFGPAGLLGPPAQCLSWPNYCAPVSAANVWQFFDTRDGAAFAPWFIGPPLDDLPQPGNPPAVPLGWSISWSNASIQGQGSDPAAGRLPVHMNTNDALGCLSGGSGWNGTKIIDSYFGTQSYAWTLESANAMSKLRYTVTAQMDEDAPYVPPTPGTGAVVTTEGPAYANYCNAVDGDIPTIVFFNFWVDTATMHDPGNGVEYYFYDTSAMGGDPGGGEESWEEWGELSGHAVTGVGYHKNFDPDGEGNLPLADWYIVRDNWMSTGKDVAVPVQGYWKATLYLGAPNGPLEEEGYASANLTEVDFSVDTDYGPIGLYSSHVYNEELIGENAEDDFYLTPFPPGATNFKTFDENIPPGFVPALNFGTFGVDAWLPMPENTDAYCFGSTLYTTEYNIWPDNGDGTVDLPVLSPYFAPTEYLQIIDGLPPGTTIASTFHIDSFFDVYVEPGGSMGGEKHIFHATLHLKPMVGQGELAGYRRMIEMPIAAEVHVGLRKPGDPVQDMPADWFVLTGALYGDPDFASLEIIGGGIYGLPSPGSLTLTQLPSGDFAVDSFFDITYQIEFVGAPGGVLDGLAGTTTGVLHVEQGGIVPGETSNFGEAVQNGRLFTQFTVDTTAKGLPGTAVRLEYSKSPPEAAGDVYEAMPGAMSNVLIADDFTLGLETVPLDDINSLVIADEHLHEPLPEKFCWLGQGVKLFAQLPRTVDTDGDQHADAPVVFFSIKNTGLQGNLGNGLIGDFVLMTAPYNSGAPSLNVAWTAANLGLPGVGLDELDALFVENPGDGGQQPANPPLVYFSLATGSQSLGNSPVTSPIANPFTGGTGCDPGDIILVRPAITAGVLPTDLTPPAFGPAVVLQAASLGLTGNSVPDGGGADDDLNGLHVSAHQFDTDLDGDGLSDGWETLFGVTNPAGDPDNDGLDNATEQANGTNPRSPDTDGDGYSDDTELSIGTDPRDPNSFGPFSPVWVNFGWAGSCLGTHAHPCATLAGAVAKVSTAGVVNLRGDVAVTSSTETPRIVGAMEMQAISGTVRIGVSP